MLLAAAVPFLSLVFTFPAFSQDEDSVTGKMTDANNIAAGTAEIERDTGWATANCWKNLWKINQ